MGMPSPVYFTPDMVRVLPDDGNRYETVHGELLVTPAPGAWHQELVVRMLMALRRYAERRGTGHVLVSPADISWSDDVLVQPDVFVVDLDEARTMDWASMKTVQLAVEVLSPSTARYDRFTKRRLYQEIGIPCYWIIDPDEEAVEVWTPDDTAPRVERTSLTWQPPQANEPLVIDLGTLFRPL